MTTHVCDSGIFDRNLCADPCNGMHFFCSGCGQRQDPCWFEEPLPYNPEEVQSRRFDYREVIQWDER